MAEVLDPEKQAEKTAETPTAPAFSEATPAPKKKKKNKKKIVRRIIALVIVAALLGGGVFAWKKIKGGNAEQPSEVLTELVTRGSITSMVKGSGAAVAKNSESITLLSAGMVREVFVAEGDEVTAGTPLFEVDSTEAEDAARKAQERVRNAESALSKARDDLAKYLAKPTEGDARAEYAGILIDVQKKSVGEEIAEKAVIAKLVDNTRMLLTLYFSYAYENSIYVGQSATVSVPVTMSQLPGEVYEIHKVERISKEGGRLFEVVIALDNPGTLTASVGEAKDESMIATATLSAGGETIYPYESGTLEFFRTTEIKIPLSGTVTAFGARNYQKVAAGESIAHIKMDLEGREEEIKRYNESIESAEKTLEDAQKALEKAQENLNALSGVATIDGTVISLGIHPGDEVKAGTVAVSIADTSTMIVNAMLDEMYVSYAKAGMPVTIRLWENELMGVIESVSLSAKAENGIARFPMVISVDNSEGLLMSGAYVDYSFTASQSDDCLLVPIQCVKSAQTADGENCKILFVQTDVPPENPVELATDMMQIPDGFWPVYVETGISDTNNVEILSGVEEGTVVYASVVENNGGGGMGMYF